MKISTIFLIGIALFCITSTAECRVPTCTRCSDLLTPFQQLIDHLSKSTLDFGKLLSALVKFLGNCVPPATSPTPVPFTNAKNLELKDPFQFTPEIIEQIKNYMKSSEYMEIHNYLWNYGETDTEWRDLILFLYTYKFDGENCIFTMFKNLYTFFECPLIIPDCPTTTSPIKNSHRKKRTAPSPRNTKNQPPTSKFATLLSQFQEPDPERPKCDLLLIFQELVDSNALNLLDMIKFIMSQVNTNPSVHILWAKISEQRKGLAFREFRELKEIVVLLDHWDKGLKNNELYRLVIDVVEALTGIDFSELNINIVANIISLVEFFVWGTVFPVPV